MHIYIYIHIHTHYIVQYRNIVYYSIVYYSIGQYRDPGSEVLRIELMYR